MIKDIIQKYKIYGLRKFILYAFAEIRYKIYAQIIKGSYSQCGEDVIIDKILGFKKNGFYVDIGAYDPTRFSNTQRFYLKGWRGINIEPNPRRYLKFLKERENDINLNIGIADRKDNDYFYEFFPDTLYTFSGEEKDRYEKQGYQLVKEIKIEIDTLASVLDKYAQSKNIDFLSVDTEGFDLVVLKSNDWVRFRPKVICIESSKHNIVSDSVHNTSKKCRIYKNL